MIRNTGTIIQLRLSSSIQILLQHSSRTCQAIGNYYEQVPPFFIKHYRLTFFRNHLIFETATMLFFANLPRAKNFYRYAFAFTFCSLICIKIRKSCSKYSDCSLAVELFNSFAILVRFGNKDGKCQGFPNGNYSGRQLLLRLLFLRMEGFIKGVGLLQRVQHLLGGYSKLHAPP